MPYSSHDLSYVVAVVAFGAWEVIKMFMSNRSKCGLTQVEHDELIRMSTTCAATHEEMERAVTLLRKVYEQIITRRKPR